MARKPFKAVPLKRGWPNRSYRRRGRASDYLVLLGLVGCAAGFGAYSASAGHADAASRVTYLETSTDCRVVDGDTLRCVGGRIRLLGIDAPELPGHCAAGRDCAPGNPYESTRSLEEALGDASSVKIKKVGTDRYGRILAMVAGAKGDLSCWQLEHGEAIYKPRWDDGGLVAATCPDFAR